MSRHARRSHKARPIPVCPVNEIIHVDSVWDNPTKTAELQFRIGSEESFEGLTYPQEVKR